MATTLNIEAASGIIINDNTDKLIKLSAINIDSQIVGKSVELTSLTTTATAAAADTISIIVTGAGNAIVGVDTNFGTYNASNNADRINVTGTGTGDVSVGYNVYAANTVSTGAGNDTVTIASGSVLKKVDNIHLGAGSSDAIAVTAVYDGSHNVIDLVHDDDVLNTDPTISGVEFLKVTLDDPGGAANVATTSASFANTIELNGDIEDTVHTINNIGTSQGIKIGGTLDLTDSSSALVLVQDGATASLLASSLAITSDLLDTSTDGNIDDLRANVVKSVTLDLASTDFDVITATVDEASFDNATSVKVTSAENITFGSIDAADDAILDFTGVTGTLSVTVDTLNDYSVKGSLGSANTFIMGNGLDSDDIITGGSASTDSLTAIVNGLTAATGKLAITGVESFAFDVTATSTLDLTDVTGVTSISNNNNSSGANLTLENLKSVPTINITGNDDDTTINLEDSAVSGSSDVLTLNVSSMTSNSNVTVTKDTGSNILETLTINSNSAANTISDIQTTSAGTTGLNIGGSQDLTIATVLDNEIITINTASATGNMTYGFGTGAVSVTGGAGVDTVTANSGVNTISLAGGNDLINFSGTHLTSDDTVNGGAGTDIISYSSDETIALADFTNVSGFEALTSANSVNIAGNLGALAATAGIKTVTFNDDGDGDNLVIDAAFNNTLRVNLDDGDNTLDASAYTGTLTVSITEAIADASADIHTVTGGTGAADVILLTADGTGIDTTDMTTFIGFEKLTVVNNASTGTIVLSNANIADGSTLTVNSSAITTATNTFTLDTSAETDGILVVTGSSGINTITMSGSDQGDTITLGGVADVIKVATANLTADDTVAGGAGTDVIKMTDASTVVDADFTKISSVESIMQETSSHDMTLTLGTLAFASGIVTVNAGTGTNALTVEAGYTGALAVYLSCWD